MCGYLLAKVLKVAQSESVDCAFLGASKHVHDMVCLVSQRLHRVTKLHSSIQQGSTRLAQLVISRRQGVM